MDTWYKNIQYNAELPTSHLSLVQYIYGFLFLERFWPGHKEGV